MSEAPTAQGAPAGTTALAPQEIAQVIGSFSGGGAQRLAWNLACALSNRRGASLAIALRAGVRPGPAEAIELGLARGALDMARGPLALARVLRERRVRVVHAHGSESLPLVALACGLVQPRPLLCFTWHDSGSVLAQGGVRGVALRSALRRCDVLSGSSRSVCDRLDEALGKRRAVVFRNGVPPSPAATDPPALPTILWMGRLVPQKDPMALLRAAADLRDRGLRFGVLLVGDALPHQRPFADSVCRLRRELDLEETVQMPGWLEDTAGAIAACNIYAQTSRTEGLSMSLLEAMMAGLAPVATDVGDTSDAVRHGRSGLLVQPDDLPALVDALESLISDCGRRLRIADEARHLAQHEFSLEAMAGRAVRMYEGMLGPGGRG